ncbi:MAG: LysR family transcriptional regulator [Myxococcaceae bacterium]|nr:LysR family transcriptional regulator [Myxococcaceae bacterium]
MTTNRVEALRAFRAVAELKSFTAAARRLAMDKSQVSRMVQRLEQGLGVALLVRTTRSVRPTAEGDALLGRVGPALEEIDRALEAAGEASVQERGEVVMTTTSDLAHAWLAKALVGFRQTHPLVRVRLVLTNEVVDLSRAEVDLALRVGRPGGENVVARRLGELAAGFYASPAYLERRGTPTRLEQLAAHEGLWPMPRRGQRAFAPPTPPVSAAVTCADFAFLAEVARAGGGVALLPLVLAERHVSLGSLVRVLPSVTFGGAPLFLVSRAVRSLPSRVASLRTYLLGLVVA